MDATLTLTQRKLPSPIFADFMSEVRHYWAHSLSNCIPTQGVAQFTAIFEEDLLLARIPPVRDTVALVTNAS